MNATLAGTEVGRYLDAVRAHLVDLPEDDRDELLDDLAEHLREVAAEGEGTLESRLGPPAEYAAELRTSAGLPSREQIAARRTARRVADRVTRSAPGRAITAIGSSSAARSLRRFLPELQPGWWVLRGYLAVLAAAIITSQGSARTNIPIPYVAGSHAVGFAAAVGAIWLSVRLGRRAKGRRNLFWPIVVNAAVVIASFSALAGYSPRYVNADESGYQPLPFLHHAEGQPIANICPYSSDGKLLSGVVLFDQDGRPIIDTASNLGDGRPVAPAAPLILNAYPRALYAPSPLDGSPQAVTCPPSVAPVPKPSAGVPSAGVPSAGVPSAGVPSAGVPAPGASR